MKRLCFLVLGLVLSLPCFAQHLVCNEMQGMMYVPMREKYIPINGEGRVFIHISGENAIVLNGKDKVECIVIQNTPNFITFINSSPVSTNMFTYFWKDNRLYYSKHSIVFNIQSQYTAECKEED